MLLSIRLPLRSGTERSTTGLRDRILNIFRPAFLLQILDLGEVRGGQGIGGQANIILDYPGSVMVCLNNCTQ